MGKGQNDLACFIERIPIGIVVLNSGLQIEMRNDLSLHLLDVGDENLLNPDFMDLVKDRTCLKDSILQVHSGTCQQERVMLGVGEKTLRCTILSAGDMNAGGLIVLMEDATSSNKIEQIKREFIGTLLHKIRSPLATIKTSLSMLSFKTDDPGSHFPPEVQEIFTMCSGEVNRLSLLINDMRDLFLIETNLAEKDMEPEDFAVATAISGAIGDLKKSFSSEPIDTRIVFVGNAVPPIHADYEKTKKIFFVLLKNALRYSAPDAPVFILFSVDDDSMNIIIKDRGIGIADSLANQVFSKYFREDNFATRNNAGNGLGLFIAKSYIDMMNGTMYFDSKQGEGSSFYLTFPLATRK
jgi:signal transduction histidine kinase